MATFIEYIFQIIVLQQMGIYFIKFKNIKIDSILIK